MSAAQCTHDFRQRVGRECPVTELGNGTELCENLAVTSVRETSPTCLVLASVMDAEDSPSYGDYMCKFPQSEVLTSACVLAGYRPKTRPEPVQPSSEEPDTAEEDDMQWLPLKRSNIAFIGALTGYDLYRTHKKWGRTRQASREQDRVIKSFACRVNPIVCSTTEDLKGALKDKGVDEDKVDDVASLLQGHLDAITTAQFRDTEEIHRPLTQMSLTEDYTSRTNKRVLESIKQVAEVHGVSEDNLKTAVEQVFTKHKGGDYRFGQHAGA